MSDKITMPLIRDFKQFKESWEKNAATPEQTILHYLNAALVAEANPKLADAMMSLIVSKNQCYDDSSSPSGLKLGRSAKYMLGQLKKDPNIAKSYVGGSPSNDYDFDEKNLTMTIVRRQDLAENKKKIFIDSAGKDFNTPTQLARNRHGQWKLIEFSSIATGVQKPESEEGDF